MAFSLVETIAAAQAVSDRDLLQERPFDIVVLKQSQGGETHKVLPLPFADRRVPSPFPSGWLRLRLVSQPGSDFEVAWSDIQRVALFEQMLLDRAAELTEARDFTRAFDFFARLHKEYPDAEGLAAATEQYLTANAEKAFRDGDYDMAMAMMLSINDRYPQSPTLGRAVDTVAGKLIEARVAERDFRGARAQLDIVERRFANVDLKVTETWQRRFQQAADAKSREAAERVAGKDYNGARVAISQAIAVWPSHEASRRLLAELDRLYPQVLVGVTTASLPTGPRTELRIDAPAALRTSPLTSPTITQLVGYAGEGGVYGTPLGEVFLDDTGRYLEFAAYDDQSPYTLARWLAHATDPAHPLRRPTLAGIVSSLRVDAPDRVVVSLARSHFRPEALLKNVPLTVADLDPSDLVEVVQQDPARLVAKLAVAGNSRGSTVEEQVFATDEAAVAALGSGVIDVMANVPPWRLAALRDKRDIKVGRYLLPTVHGLIPTKRHPLLDEREFRRALLYGINRERILNEVLLGNETEEGYRVVSGPFPYGLSLADPVRYGYNDAVAPRPFEPRLSVILSAVAWTKVQKAEGGKDDPADDPLPVLTLAHAPDPLARTACQSIQLQLAGVGFEIELIELPESELLAEDPDFDLRYAELASWEPAVDAAALLGPGGLTGRCSDPMEAALRRLDNARNTKEVQRTLFEVHRLAHGDLPFLPLWQTAKHFAYREGLIGVPSAPVSLYASVGQWRKQPPPKRRRGAL